MNRKLEPLEFWSHCKKLKNKKYMEMLKKKICLEVKDFIRFLAEQSAQSVKSKINTVDLQKNATIKTCHQN